MSDRGRLGSRLRAAASVGASLYLAVQLCMAAWVAVPALALGWSPEVTVGDAMSPSLEPGDVVLVDRRPAGGVQVGTLVVVGDGESDVRRVAKLADDGTFRTKGDAEDRVAPTPHDAADVHGVGRLLIPVVGTPAMWWETGRTMPFVAWVVSVAAAVVLARRPGAWGRARTGRRVTFAGAAP